MEEDEEEDEEEEEEHMENQIGWSPAQEVSSAGMRDLINASTKLGPLAAQTYLSFGSLSGSECWLSPSCLSRSRVVAPEKAIFLLGVSSIARTFPDLFNSRHAHQSSHH